MSCSGRLLRPSRGYRLPPYSMVLVFFCLSRSADQVLSISSVVYGLLCAHRAVVQLTRFSVPLPRARYLFLEPNPGDPLNHEAAEATYLVSEAVRRSEPRCLFAGVAEQQRRVRSHGAKARCAAGGRDASATSKAG